VVVAVDPSGSSKGAETGIIAAGFSPNGHIYVQSDHSLRASPERWGRAVVAAYQVHRADRIVAERNFGGNMVASVIRSVDSGAPVRMVVASRGKTVRAEPVSRCTSKAKSITSAHSVGWKIN
jgi:phage terminase large subunit-like protein